MALPKNPREGDIGYDDNEKKHIFLYNMWHPYEDYLRWQQEERKSSTKKRKLEKFRKSLKKVWNFPGTAPAYGETLDKWRKNKDREQEDWGEIGE